MLVFLSTDLVQISVKHTRFVTHKSCVDITAGFQKLKRDPLSPTDFLCWQILNQTKFSKTKNYFILNSSSEVDMGVIQRQFE